MIHSFAIRRRSEDCDLPLVAEHGETEYIHGGTQKDEYGPEDLETVACPFCGGTEHRRIYTEHGLIGICRCSACDLVYTSPRLKAPEKVYWGSADLYFAEARLIFEGKSPHHRDPNYRAELRSIARYQPNGRFLDVGCNMGMLLRLARGQGWEVIGVEPSPTLAGLAGRWGAKIYNCFLHELPESEFESFDIVALSDVFEHIGTPREFLETTGRYLKPGGILFVKVPNVRWSLLKQHLLGLVGRRPKKGLWDSYEHVVHYSDRSLRKMLGAAGYRVLEIGIDPPVQTPNWHELVGHYYQYPTPWTLDPARKLVRSTFYRLAQIERVLGMGRVGYCAPNLAVIARRR